MTLNLTLPNHKLNKYLKPIPFHRFFHEKHFLCKHAQWRFDQLATFCGSSPQQKCVFILFIPILILVHTRCMLGEFLINDSTREHKYQFVN